MRGQHGQATVELALILPVVVLLALIVGQVGVIVVDSLLVHHAAREAARAAAVEPTRSVAGTAARGAAGLPGERLSISTAGGTNPGDTLSVTVRYLAPTSVPLVGRFIGDIELSSTIAVRVE